jgi:hypothetical protein
VREDHHRRYLDLFHPPKVLRINDFPMQFRGQQKKLLRPHIPVWLFDRELEIDAAPAKIAHWRNRWLFQQEALVVVGPCHAGEQTGRDRICFKSWLSDSLVGVLMTERITYFDFSSSSGLRQTAQS